MQYFIDCEARLLMDGDRALVLEDTLVDVLGEDGIVVEVASGGFPDGVDALLVVELFEDAVASEEDEVVVVSDFEALDVWGWDHALRVATVSRVLGFDITNRPRNGESAGVDSVRPDDHLNA